MPTILDRLTRMSYTQGMSNITELRSAHDLTQTRRAAFVRESLTDERWSIRQAAMAIGMSHTALGSRCKGETGFLADELEAIAGLLKREPVEFYADYLAAGGAGHSGPAPVGPARVELARTTV